jgi:hypothetical protein
MSDPTPDVLIQEHHKLDDHIKAQSKAFSAYLKPFKDRLEAIENRLLTFLNTTKQDSCSTEFGTAYKSEIMTPKITDRDKFIDFCNQMWDTFGNEMLQLRPPQVDGVRSYMQEHNGAVPPGVDVSFFTRLNVRRS